jgi:hypothetical protein
MAKFTNKTKGPKVVNTTTGQVILAPGETLDSKYEVRAADAKAMSAVGFLDGDTTAAARPTVAAMGTTPTPDTDADSAEKLADANSKDQLLEIAKTEGVENVTDSMTKAEIAAAIIEARNA